MGLVEAGHELQFQACLGLTYQEEHKSILFAAHHNSTRPTAKPKSTQPHTHYHSLVSLSVWADSRPAKQFRQA
jgi:hypothetical protein